MPKPNKESSKSEASKPSTTEKALTDLPAQAVKGSASQVKGGGSVTKFVKR